ncbi:MAG TPA: elongation factor G [Dehalococcoidia bacterium]|nr:elongation factor G [Dehalococcoidia bacterium]
MKEYPPDKIRNVALIGHGSTGKTSLAEGMLFASGATTRLGRVEDGTTLSDWDPDEQKRGFSVNLAVVPVEANGCKLNVVDAPGYADFMGEVKCALRAADLALVVVCGASGVQVGTEFAWQFAEELSLPRAVFINRMDRENADFNATLRQLQSSWGQKCVPLQIPIGSQHALRGVVDLLAMKAYVGEKGEQQDVPAELTDEANAHREKLIEAAAETDDALIEKYLGGEELTPEELSNGVRAGVLAGTIVPVLTGSATKMFGMQALLQAAGAAFPSPADAPVKTNGDTLKADASAPLVALVFKTAADPYVGRLTYFRVFSGTFKADSQAWNANRQAAERIGPVYHMHGKTQEQVQQVTAGDIGAVAKLTETQTGDTLCSKEKPVTLPAISFPDPAFSAAITPKTKADLDKMGSALQRIVEEDPSLRVERSPDGETILSGLGDSHVEVALEKIRRKFGVELEMTLPRVPYRETVLGTATAEYTHKKQTGGHGQFARVSVTVEPLPRGSGHAFENKTVGGVVPKQYVGSVEKGVAEAMLDGVLAHHPMVDMKVKLVDGKEHPVDSSDIAFKIAAAQAVKKGAQDAQPVLLEPIMNMKITVPEANTGDIISDLNGKRARVQGMTPMGTMTTVEAQAPLAEVQRYSADLRSMTQGRGHFSMSFSHYEEVPAHVAQKLIEAASREREAAKA